MLLRRLLLCAALAGAPLAASAQGMTMGKAAGTPADRAFMASMQSMMKQMAVRPTHDPDRDFATMMLPHHQGAVDMAQIELRYGRDPEMRRLARAIVAAQEKEIGQMTRWLRRHGH